MRGAFAYKSLRFLLERPQKAAAVYEARKFSATACFVLVGYSASSLRLYVSIIEQALMPEDK